MLLPFSLKYQRYQRSCQPLTGRRFGREPSVRAYFLPLLLLMPSELPQSLQNELHLASCKKLVLKRKLDKKPVTFSFKKEVCMQEEIMEKRKNSTTTYLAGTEWCVTICACFRAPGILYLEEMQHLHPTN